MDLRNVASFFNKTEVRDGYDFSGPPLFLGQLDVYDDSKRDGVGTERRILEVDPRVALTIPLHRTVRISEHRWIIGASQPDDFMGKVIREKFTIQRAEETFQHQNAARWIQGVTPVSEACGSVWTKDVKNEDTSDEVRSFYTLWTSLNTSVRDGDFVSFLGRLHRVRNSFQSPSGFRAVEIVEMPIDAFKIVTFHASAAGFDPVRGENVGSAGTWPVTAIVMQHFDEYRLVNLAMIKPKRGDLMIRVMRDAVPGMKTGDRFTVSDVSMEVVTFLPEPDMTWLVHLTR